MSIETKTRCDAPDCYACWYDETDHAGAVIKLISHKYCSYGDYDNSCAVERANVRYLGEKNLIEYEETGGYGGVQAWLLDTPENRELLESLDGYPAFDDELVSEVEREIEEEYIKDNDDIWRATPEPLRSILDDLDLRCIIPDIYYTVKERLNMYFEVESGGNGWIDLKKMEPAYNEELLARNPAIAMLLEYRSRAAAWPITFYESATDMLGHCRATGRAITAEEAQQILQYAADLEC